MAVAGEDALIVATVFDCDRKSLGQIAKDAWPRREGARQVDHATEPSGATFTVSNLGMFGIEQFTAIINLPQRS